jgi:hypothetical protein
MHERQHDPGRMEGQAMPGLLHSGHASTKGKNLTANSRRSRDQAETAFSKTQTQSLSLGRIVSEQDAVSRAREEKTARLRELRLQKEAADQLAAAIAPAPKRKAKS